MQATRLLVILALAGSTAVTARAAGDGPYSRGATAHCLAGKHLRVHEGTDTSVPGNYPDLTFRYQGSELTVAFLPVQTSDGALGFLGASILNAFARVDATLQKAGNAVFYSSSANLTAGGRKLIKSCLD